MTPGGCPSGWIRASPAAVATQETGFDDSVKQTLGANPESLASLPHGHASRQYSLLAVFCTYTSEWLSRIVADFGRNTTIGGAMRGESLFVWDHM